MKKHKPNPHTVSESITATLKNGKTVAGTLWLHPSRKGSFEVEYKGIRHSDYRTDYQHEGHMRGIALAILLEMAEK